MLQDQPPDTSASNGRAAVTSPAGVVIRPMEPTDAGQVLAVYQAGLDTGLASFETTAPGWEAFDAAKMPGHRFIAADGDGEVLGWVAVSPVSARRVYAWVVEHSVYVRPDYHRRGIGAALLRALIGSTEAAGIWTIQSSIFPEHTASPAAAPAGRVPRRGNQGADRPPSRPVAGHGAHRAAQPHRRDGLRPSLDA
jgi:L-amino acid N-acyltransferase YncA